MFLWVIRVVRLFCGVTKYYSRHIRLIISVITAVIIILIFWSNLIVLAYTFLLRFLFSVRVLK